jgi:hypothetical protein
LDVVHPIAQAQLSIVSLTGVVVYQTGTSLQAGLNTISVGTAEWANGIYLLQTKMNDEIQVQKISIQH